MNLISYLVLILLVIAWTWVLGRPLLQNLLNSSRRDPVGHFNRQLSVLGQAPQESLRHGPRAFADGFSRQPARHRRLQWFLGFLIAAAVTLVLAVVLGGIFVWQHLLIDAMLAVYVIYAAKAGAVERERSMKVTSLRAVPSPAHAETPYLRAVGER